jgi:hypothetical protein
MCCHQLVGIKQQESTINAGITVFTLIGSVYGILSASKKLLIVFILHHTLSGKVD